jgi:UDP-N-acetyl-D-mannosaminuronic acid transferase (WecB/TagA/CpsF family)
MAVKYLGDYGPDGVCMGRAAADKIGFYGTTPVIQASTFTAVATTGSTSTTNAFGFTTAAQADAIVTAVNAIITCLENVGLAA